MVQEQEKVTSSKLSTKQVFNFSTSRPGSNVNFLNVLLSLPMGKAVHNFNGSTLQSVFPLPVSQFQSDLPALSVDVAKQL
jgi:hypothetical protein